MMFVAATIYNFVEGQDITRIFLDKLSSIILIIISIIINHFCVEKILIISIHTVHQHFLIHCRGNLCVQL